MATWLVEDYPGPGEYTPNIDFVKTVYPKYSIPCSTWRYEVDVCPGPGTYNIPRKIPGPYYTMAAKKHYVIKKQGPKLPPPARGHCKDYGWFGWQPKEVTAEAKKKKVGQGIIIMHYKQQKKEMAQVPT